MEADLTAGLNLVLVVPDSFSEESRWGDLEDLTRLLSCEELTVEPGVALADAIIERLGSDGSEPRTADLLPWVSTWSAMRGRRLILRAWESETRDAVFRWPQVIHAAGIPPAERPTITVVTRLQDLDVVKAERLNISEFRVHWWWGVTDLLDTETVVTRAAPFLNPLERCMAAELAAWDFTTAVALCDEWDGNVAQLEVAYSKATSNWSAYPAMSVPPNLMGGRSPRPDARSKWAAGEIDLWSGEVRQRYDARDQQMFARCLWRAQARVLLPRLEEARHRAETRLLKEVPSYVRDELSKQTRSDGVLEFASMRRTLRDQGYRVESSLWQLISSAIPVRNSLAHMVPPQPGDVERLLQWMRMG